jgi:hypothetical protein
MKKFLSEAFDAYHKYRNFKKQNRAYKIFRYTLTGIFAAYFLTLVFPQYLFAHEVSHKNFKVYARQPLDENINRVLDLAEERLVKSPIYDKAVTERIFISDTAFYTFQYPLSRKSFASTLPGIGHIRINKVDVAGDLVFRDSQTDNQRSLSGVIAHEVTHNLIRKKFGLISSFTSLPNWKDEGYCEYVAGDATLSFEEGSRRWKENPNNDSKYTYFKYHQMVKYLIDVEKISVEELFNKDFDEKELEAKVFEFIKNGKG